MHLLIDNQKFIESKQSNKQLPKAYLLRTTYSSQVEQQDVPLEQHNVRQIALQDDLRGRRDN